MSILSELILLFGVCLAGEGVSLLLPFPFPASVASLLLLAALLLSGRVAEYRLERLSAFFTENMGLFFLPASVGIANYFDVLRPQLLPFLLIVVVTTPLVYCVTAWTVQAVRALSRTGKKGVGES